MRAHIFSAQKRLFKSLLWADTDDVIYTRLTQMMCAPLHHTQTRPSITPTHAYP